MPTKTCGGILSSHILRTPQSTSDDKSHQCQAEEHVPHPMVPIRALLGLHSQRPPLGVDIANTRAGKHSCYLITVGVAVNSAMPPVPFPAQWIVSIPPPLPTIASSVDPPKKVMVTFVDVPWS
jgi:hypothetical protein